MTITPRRQAQLVRAIEDHAARVAFTGNPARYIADGYVAGATPEERTWIADYIHDHAEVLERTPPPLAELQERDRVELARAVQASNRSFDAYTRGDYEQALELLDEAERLAPDHANWEQRRQIVRRAMQRRRAE